MRMLRGCGLDGLGGIPIRRDSIVRPLLDCSRSAARAFLAEQDLTFCEDSSNADRRFLRNRVRHDILPRLAAAEPGVVERLARAAQRAREEASALDELLRAPLEQALDGDESLDAGAVLGLSHALRGRFLRLWLRLVRGHLRNLSAVHLDQLVALAQRDGGSSIVTLPGADRVYFEYGRLRFARGGRNLAFAPVRLGFEERLELPTGWVLQTTVTSTKDRTDTDRRNLHMVADADKLRGAIVVRPPCAGDRLQPLGMTGHKKLQDILVDLKIASRLRPTLPVLEVGGEILWVAGVVRSGHALLSEATKHTLNVVAEQVGIAGA